MASKPTYAQSESAAASASGAQPTIDSCAGLRIKDDHLRAVLRGEAYLLQDGAMGTQLQQRGLANAGEVPDLLNLTNPQAITDIHRAYVQAGAQMVTTNTFGANAYKLEGHATVREVFAAAADCARQAGARYVAGDIGPIGALLQPIGTMSFDEAYGIFEEQVLAIVDAGCDLVVIETMTDLREIKAAVLAARENCDLPIIATMTFGEDGRTFLGTTPEVAAITLSSLGANIVGVNCSLGPDELVPVVERLCAHSRVPVVVRPNAGLPRVENGQTVFDVGPEAFAQAVQPLVDFGASVLGGCCGTSPVHIEKLGAVIAGKVPQPRAHRPEFCVTSASRAVVFGPECSDVRVIGERINPTGKPKLKEALRAGNLDYVVAEAVSQQEAGADILDVNVGLPELDEPAMLVAAVDELQATVPLPLQIDSSDPEAIEAAVRGYAGKPLINSVNGKQSNLDAILPIVARYGCSVVGLTLDENGIPPTAEGRFAIAERIVNEAARYGIPRCDVCIDCLVMAVATNQNEARQILRAVSMVKERLGVRTVLGVSNISFGLPQRNLMNSTFLAAAFGAGLDMPILNPLSDRYRDVVATYRVLCGQDEGSVRYIESYAQAEDPYAIAKNPQLAGGSVVEASAQNVPAEDVVSVPENLTDQADAVRQMVHYILSGRRAPMEQATLDLIAGRDPLAVVNGVFVPALDVVGVKFDKGEFFLPQLMASAEAVKVGFDTVRAQMGDAARSEADDGKTIAVATVQGDIHDIGKNIVKMLLENYGFNVIDLGRDVAPQDIVDAVRERNVRLLGLSALMTTTVKAMERTIALMHEQLPDVGIMVGGAVLTPEYAKEIGADFYAKDAAESTRIASRYFE